MVKLSEQGEEVWIPVRASPRAGRSALGEVLPDGALKVKIAAPPVDGAANEELVRFLAREVLRVAPSTVRVARGETGRDKVVAVKGLGLEDVRARLAEHAKG